MRCTKCRGAGRYLPAHGITKADLRDCHICKGSGLLPAGYVVKKDTSKNRQKRYFNKRDGIILLKEVKGE